MERIDPTGRRIPRSGQRALLVAMTVTAGLSMNVVPAEAQPVQLSIFDIGNYSALDTALVNLLISSGVPPKDGTVAAGLILLAVSANRVSSNAMYAPPPASSNSMSQAMSCPVFADAGTLLGEDSCVWAKATGQWTSQSGTNNSSGFYSIGGQKELVPNWFVGGAIGVGSLRTQDGNGNTGTGQGFGGSVALKHTVGPWLFAGALAFNTGSTHNTQASGLLQSDVDVYNGGLRLRGAYDFAFAGWYIRPRADLDLMYTSRPGFIESGQGVAVLAVDGYSKTSFAATPMVELGGRYVIDEKTILRPYVAAGASFLPDNTTTVSATFVGPLASLGGFQATLINPSVLANVEAGLQIYQAQWLEAKVEYTLSAGDNFLSQGVSLRGAYHF